MLKASDLTGMKFGRLTAICRTDDYISPSNFHYVQWLCKCECGKEIIATANNLKRGNTKSCGCYNEERRREVHSKDLTGKKFGRLLVVGLAENKGKKRMWQCVCDCGKETTVSTSNLTCGHTLSCGCYCSERTHDARKKYNDYEIQEDYVIMYTTKGEPFFVDLEDFWKVKDICWHKSRKGYIVSKSPKLIFLHQIIMDCPKGLKVDHIGGASTRNDNRKYNLRIATIAQNSINKRKLDSNTSGVTGVSWNKRVKKWTAYIGINHKRIHLGYFANYEDAVQSRKQAEEKYFGEWSYDNSQELWRGKSA